METHFEHHLTRDKPEIYISETSEKFPEFKPRTEVSTCVIEWQGKYLFLKRTSKEDQGGLWGIPGGKLEEEESSIAAMTRELLEETRWKVAPENLFYRAKLYGRVPNWDYILHVFYMTIHEEPPKIILDSNEHDEYQWVSLEEIKNLKLIKGQHTVFEIINLSEDQKIGRIHVAKLPKRIQEASTEIIIKDIQPFARRVIINLIGTTGVGKGTQGEYLNTTFGYGHISIGDLFRNEILNKTDLSAQILWHDERTNSTRYNPDEIALGIIAKRISDNDCIEGFILDGFPRTEGQSKALVKTFLRPDDLHIPIWMKIDDQHIYDRIAGRFICPQCATQVRSLTGQKKPEYCQKCDVMLIKRVEDASKDKVTKRLKIFSDNIDAVLSYIRLRDHVYVLHIDDTHFPQDVFEAIENIVTKALKNVSGVHQQKIMEQ